MVEVKVSFDSVEEMLEFFGDKAGKAGKAGSVQQVAQVAQVAQEQEVMAEPATPAAQPIAPQPPQPQQQAKQYTKDEIARACAPLANDPESMRMLQELLASYNAISLHDLDKSQYPDFAEKLRNLGVSV